MRNSGTDVQRAQASLCDFLNAMHGWEEKHYLELMDLPEGNAGQAGLEQAAHELERIFETYCMPGKADRRRLKGPRIGCPAEYDLKRDRLYFGEESKGSLLFIYQQNIGAGVKIRFTMRKHQNDWRIHKAEYFDPAKDAWQRHML